MAQKSITSYFKPKDCNERSIETERLAVSSSRKRRQIDSDSDEDNALDITKNQRSQENLSSSLQSSPDHKSYDKHKSNNLVKSEVVAELKFQTIKETEQEEKNPPVSSKSNILNINEIKQDHIGADYNPAKSNYHPIDDAFWKKKESTPYLALARTFQLIEEIRGRYKMIEVLSNFFSSVIVLNSDDLLPCIYLSINQLAPAYEGLELGVAETTLMKVICNATGRKLSFIKSQTHIIGDLGIVAEKSRISQRMMFQPALLTVQGVYKKLREIANISGQLKATIIQDIFVACRYSEARFFIRSLIGKLRIGIAEQSLLQALAFALLKTQSTSINLLPSTNTVNEAMLKKKAEEISLILKTAYSQCPNFDKIIPTIIEHGINEVLERCPMYPGIPIKPMLAQPTKGVREVLERLEGLDIACEWKYDGERAQIHCNENGLINIYSRNQENNTSKYPDIIDRIKQFIKEPVCSFIIDSEIVAWDVERKQILPFQVLSTRKRKNVDLNEIKVQVCVYAFDLLYLNGKPLVTETFEERRRLLKSNFSEEEGHWQFATALDTNDINEVQQFLEDSIKGNCEGLMIKTLHTEATYEIAKRSRNWLKLKKDYLTGVGDSLDLVVIGGYKGKGKRTGTYGGFLLACYDDENEEYQSICKIGTGFSEEDLKVHTNFLQQHIINDPKSYFRFDNTLEPDEWFDPVQVWEVKCADFSLSPVHKAAVGIVDNERGISLRFPRFIRIRTDKSPENATSAQQIANMYSCQDQIKNQKDVGVEFDDEFY